MVPSLPLSFTVGGLDVGPVALGLLLVVVVVAVVLSSLLAAARKKGNRAAAAHTTASNLVRESAHLTQMLLVSGPPATNSEAALRQHAAPVLEVAQRVTGASGAALDWLHGDTTAVLAATGTLAGSVGQRTAVRGGIVETVLRTGTV